MTNARPVFPSPGDRVRHAYADLSGVVEKLAGADYARVTWDHYGLAVAALGTMADLQKVSMLQPERQGERR
jgi:hypothetical protein